MDKTVFWSWQSDRSERETRHLIREAIVIALKQLSEDPDIQERLEIDHDTRGLPGTPDIIASILEKIEAASVFIADITPIAISDMGKHVANPNVLIELGYAKKALGTARVITVWNTAFTDSQPEDLPFDLRGRRGPIHYSLAPDASREQLSEARKSLARGLCDRISVCLDNLPQPETRALPWQGTVDGDPSLWVKPGVQIKVNEPGGSGVKTFTDGGRWYLRLLPTSFDSSVLDTGVRGPVVEIGGYSCGRTRGGLLTYSGSVRANVSPELEAASIWFQETGEIWAFQTGIGGDFRGRPVFYGDHIPEKWAELLDSGLTKLVESGAKAPYYVRLGVTGLDGLYWDLGPTLGGAPPTALENKMESEFVTNGNSSSDWVEGLSHAWTDLRRVFAMPPPQEEAIQALVGKVTH